MTNGVRLAAIRGVLAVAASAYAGHLAIRHATAIDLALPFLCALIAVAACVSRGSLLLGVSLLVVIENVIPDEHVRILLFGAVMAGVFGIAVATSGGERFESRTDEAIAAVERIRGAALAVAALLLLRWIPFDNVRLVRELLILAFAAALVEILGRTPLAIAVAVVTGLVTPAFPLRTFALPFGVVIVALIVARILARFEKKPLRLAWPSAVAVAFVVLFFPWSGVVARALPYFLRPLVPERPRLTLNYAIAPGGAMRIDVPPNARALIVSGANVAHLRRGTLIGHIAPGGFDIRIGDIADWGYMRRDHFYDARNPLPHNVAGRLREWGYAAWVDGAGRLPLPPYARTIVVSAPKSLPPGATLQVEAFELR
ncbi:MAG TPA: hypothetical protein VFO89_05105 [Thermoanaerobaculia bacterium]|nr:hypothetical protein [Thermoanaerobaculia bacterium]